MPWMVLLLKSVSDGKNCDKSFLPIPMTLGVLVKWCKHDWKDDFHVIANQVTEIFIVPEV